MSSYFSGSSYSNPFATFTPYNLASTTTLSPSSSPVSSSPPASAPASAPLASSAQPTQLLPGNIGLASGVDVNDPLIASLPNDTLVLPTTLQDTLWSQGTFNSLPWQDVPGNWGNDGPKYIYVQGIGGISPQLLYQRIGTNGNYTGASTNNVSMALKYDTGFGNSAAGYAKQFNINNNLTTSFSQSSGFNKLYINIQGGGAPQTLTLAPGQNPPSTDWILVGTDPQPTGNFTNTGYYPQGQAPSGLVPTGLTQTNPTNTFTNTGYYLQGQAPAGQVPTGLTDTNPTGVILNTDFYAPGQVPPGLVATGQTQNVATGNIINTDFYVQGQIPPNLVATGNTMSMPTGNLIDHYFSSQPYPLHLSR